MTVHPLIERSRAKAVRQSKEFRAAAAEMTGEQIAEDYRKAIDAAPRRGDAGKRFLGVHPKKAPVERRSGHDETHLGMALVAWAGSHGDGLELPEGGHFLPVDYQVPMFTARPNKADANDPNTGVDKLGLVGIGPEDRLVVASLKYVEPEGTRTGTGETPLRILLDGLAHAAFAVANREALGAEIGDVCGRKPTDDPPMLLIAATPRYWQLCRKREAQKGAAWIKEIERLGREIEEATGVAVRFISVRLNGDPGWGYEGEEGARLSGHPELTAAWERNAGRVRPKARPRSRKAAEPEDVIVEADLSRPVRDYGIRESFAAGDRIQHPTLGLGVVQGTAGTGKIHVLFGERKSLLVHERQP